MFDDYTIEEKFTRVLTDHASALDRAVEYLIGAAETVGQEAEAVVHMPSLWEELQVPADFHAVATVVLATCPLHDWVILADADGKPMLDTLVRLSPGSDRPVCTPEKIEGTPPGAVGSVQGGLRSRRRSCRTRDGLRH
jgi:hypothetical protein